MKQHIVKEDYKEASNEALLNLLEATNPVIVMQALMRRVRTDGLTHNQRELLEVVIKDALEGRSPLFDDVSARLAAQHASGELRQLTAHEHAPGTDR